MQMTPYASEDEDAMSRRLKHVELEGSKHGLKLKLNNTKCEYLKFGPAGRVHFENGDLVPLMNEV